MTTAIPVTIPINNILLNPGSLMTIRDVTWEQFEAMSLMILLAQRQNSRRVKSLDLTSASKYFSQFQMALRLNHLNFSGNLSLLLKKPIVNTLKK